MSFPVVFVGVLVIKLIISLVDKFVPQKIITEKTGARKSIQYMLNGRVLDRSHIVFAFDILDIDYKTKVYIDSVNDNYYKQLEFFEEDQKLGFKIRASIEDLKASRNYLLDSYGYLTAYN